MDFNLKQWRDESEGEEQETPSPKLPRLLLHSHHPPASASASSALPLFVPEPTTNLSAYSSDNLSSTISVTKLPRMGSYFSLAQWQELELQALIFRHMISGAAVPPELLHLVKKSLITSSPSSSSSSSPYYLCNSLHQYYPHYQSPLVQSGYWGRAAMDPEPGRCRRTDGKKWRCSRDVVAGQKYCERHMHRGRNRSRKPVEIPTSTTTITTTTYGGNGGGEALKTNHSATEGVMATAVGGGAPRFSLSEPSPSKDLLHLNPRTLDSIVETKSPFEAQNGGQGAGGRTLRHFFDDWPKSLHETESVSATNLSISMPGNPSSDFSLKLGTGNGDESRVVSGERERPQLNWATAWETGRVAPMGGPLAEALRSSMSTSSPTSVLHRLPKSSTSEASYVSS
ncbi:growth-regulating factor 3 [Sesamum indicum]|uniref:Growth-regulating factor n=1 Tax=Sesamum indicum TaxID=4182 RepID=A0A6I9U5E6_SESIN|nr:growth-regulating factor 3 [Sesamum indicum]